MAWYDDLARSLGQAPTEEVGQNPWGQGYIPQGYGPSDLQAQTPPPQGQEEGPSKSLMGRLFGGDLTEEDRKRLQMMDSGLQRIGSSFTPETGSYGRNLSSPFSGQVDVSGARNSGQVGLSQLLTLLANKSGRL